MAAVIFSNCAGGGASHPLTPDGLGSGASSLSSQRSTQSVAPGTSFEGQTATNLSDAQLDAFIDPVVTGTDRVLSRQLLRLMPVGMRGDFVYFKSDGTMISNHPAILRGATFGNLPPIVPFNVGRKLSQSGSRSTDSVVAPPGTSTTGPFAREYSALGVDAAYAYATVDCNDYVLSPVASGATAGAGFMYLGGFGNAGNGSGIDAGIQVSYLGSIQPFLNVSALGGYQSIQYNASTHYTCGGNGVGMMYGGLPGPSSLMFLATGVPPWSPEDYSQPPSSVVWSSPAWTFWQAPGDFINPGTDSTGLTTPCSNCITKRMLTISGGDSTNLYGSVSCFGACLGSIANRWDQVEMGELEQPCQTQSPAFTCTIQYYASNSWFGGYQVFPDAYAVETNENSPNNGYEGIDLSQDDLSDSAARRTKGGPKGTFSPYKPIPTPTPTAAPCPTNIPLPCNGCRGAAAVPVNKNGLGENAVNPDIACTNP